jgi:two-component system response regulator YesN
MEDINLKVIASEIYISPNYLGSLFTKFVGKTFNDYLCEYRMERAKMLLKQTNKKISTIAKEVGISNTSYFCILFKNKFGVAPGEFQHAMQRE